MLAMAPLVITFLGTVNNELGGCKNTGWGYGEDQCTCTTTYQIWKMGKLTCF